MKKYIVLSADSNPDYAYFTPLTCWAWRKFGWHPIVLTIGNFDSLPDLSIGGGLFLNTPNIEGYKPATVAQLSRLYAASYGFQDAYLMTGDIDMLPLSDYWHPKPDEITCYGKDLTGHKELPICYIGMTTNTWCDVMGFKPNLLSIDTIMKIVLDQTPNAKSDDFYKWWGVDQQIATDRISRHLYTSILRGQERNGYARGRVDRGAWSLNHEQFIDCHMFHQLYFKQNEDKFEKTIELLKTVWPDEDFGWYYNYHREFQKLTGHA